MAVLMAHLWAVASVESLASP
jgi:hypothetical protein